MNNTIQIPDLVNPYIGTLSHLLKSTAPEVLLPFSYIRSCPIVKDCCDYYSNDRIEGFPIGKASVMPGISGDFENTFDHAQEEARCYAQTLILEKNEIKSEATVTMHTHLYRFSGADELLLCCPNEEGIFPGEKEIKIHTPAQDGEKKHPGEFIVLTFDKPFTIKKKSECEYILYFSEKKFEVYAGVSYISFEKAKQSLENEVSDFDSAKKQAFDVWNKLLSRFRIHGNTRDKQIVFYTAVYHVFRRMVDFGEYGDYYSGFAGEVKSGEHFYTIDPLWDTFRTPHPLRMIMNREEEEQMLQSYVDMYTQSGLMPSFVDQYKEIPPMIGFHAAALFADAFVKGLTADYETAYEGIKKNALEQTMLPTNCDQPVTELDICYFEKGFFPALGKGEKETIPQVHSFEKRQAVSVTLEHAYDDWCVAQLAKALGKEDDFEFFMKRSHNWKNVYNTDTGFMAPRSIDGKWVEDFDPMRGGGQGGRDFFTENNGFTWLWAVPHDLTGLFELMGGKEIAEKRLDDLFRVGCTFSNEKYEYMAQFPDSTGLIGQFCMGNEPSFHIPYLYNYLGQSWKGQKRLREMMDLWFVNQPYGIPGDEDEGTLSGWLVFSALGFYPVCQGKTEYAIGTPLFDKASVDVGKGRFFTVRSEGAGDGLRYIQSAALNGKELDKPFISHEDIITGGELVLIMGNTPRKNW